MKARQTTRDVKRKAKKLREAVIGESVYIPKLSAWDDDRDRSFFARLEQYLPPRGAGFAASLALVLACGGYGLHIGGGYERAVHLYGSPGDLAARLVGFGIEKVSVSGVVELSEQEVIDLSGVTSCSRLPFWMRMR